ncbi:MAG: 4Fe-4S binding protein [Deltaproteobacteria bacterium]|nr:4Fe-4S binding protein [Deltaproteobacteria bacterium]
MTDEHYIKLQEFLDQFPLGFPKTSSGVEIKILKKLFNEEEAKLAVLLPILPETVENITEKMEMDTGNLGEKLENMSKKGLVFRFRREGQTMYRAAPFMIGLYEYSVNAIDKELAGYFREYCDIAYIDEMGASNVPGFKVMPISETLSDEMTLFPLKKVEEEIRSARIISVADCICRKESRLLDKACDYPLETCISFGVAAEYYIENKMGREVSADEAIKILYSADRAGLVHAGANSKHLSNICNCCPCCCASMKGITQKGHDKHKYMNALYEAVVDEDLCIGCGDCIDRCPVEAIEMDDTATVDRDSCLGCGLCAGVCTEEAIKLHLREDREDPFDNVMQMSMAIMEGKQKNTNQ